MSIPTWHEGDRNPSISDQITIDGVPHDLTGYATVKFKMRAANSEALKVDADVSFKDASGNWRYDWDADDLDTAGNYLVWIETTTVGGKRQTQYEAFIAVLEHGSNQMYVEVEVLKNAISLGGTTYADADIRRAIMAASADIEEDTGVRFYPSADALEARQFILYPWQQALPIYPLLELTSLKTDANGDGVFESTWAETTDFALSPLNAPLEGLPWRQVIAPNRASGLWYPSSSRASHLWFEITGKWGWATVPAKIEQATILLASRYLKRAREAPFGAIGVGPEGAVVRTSRFDPEYAKLISGFGWGALVA